MSLDYLSLGALLFSALASLLSSLAIISILRINKGAKVNVSWLLMAIGFLLGGLGMTMAVLLRLVPGIPADLGTPISIAPLVGSLLVLLGLLGWRRALKQMIK